MDIAAARQDLARVLDIAVPGDRANTRIRAAREVLINRGAEALDLSPSVGRSLDEVIALAAEAKLTPPLRDFAVLLVYALGADGLLPTRGDTEVRSRAFLERALLNPLRRAGYPFDGATYDKRRALTALHATIEEHLRPFEPSIPRWLHGLGSQERD